MADMNNEIGVSSVLSRREYLRIPELMRPPDCLEYEIGGCGKKLSDPNTDPGNLNPDEEAEQSDATDSFIFVDSVKKKRDRHRYFLVGSPSSLFFPSAYKTDGGIPSLFSHGAP